MEIDEFVAMKHKLEADLKETEEKILELIAHRDQLKATLYGRKDLPNPEGHSVTDRVYGAVINNPGLMRKELMVVLGSEVKGAQVSNALSRLKTRGILRSVGKTAAAKWYQAI